MKTFNDNTGVVLIMVLLFLLATITLGITLMRTTILEAKIVGNDRSHNQDFYRVESSAEIIIPQFDTIVSATTMGIDVRRDVSGQMPAGSIVDGANVGLTLRRVGTPHQESGNSTRFVRAYYYRIDSSINNTNVEMGVWKAFPTVE